MKSTHRPLREAVFVGVQCCGGQELLDPVRLRPFLHLLQFNILFIYEHFQRGWWTGQCRRNIPASPLLHWIYLYSSCSSKIPPWHFASVSWPRIENLPIHSELIKKKTINLNCALLQHLLKCSPTSASSMVKLNRPLFNISLWESAPASALTPFVCSSLWNT